MHNTIKSFVFFFIQFFGFVSTSQTIPPIPANVYFDKPIREWDGFGVNYVETAQTFDYKDYPQDYGGFRFLDEKAKKEIIDLVFAKDGLRPAMVKMFQDPLHQQQEGGPYDHASSTSSMRYFVKEGLKVTKSYNGEQPVVITTLYGPPAYITRQNVLRGRDLDPDKKEDLANYMISYADFLKKEGIPVKYISIHNEGESWRRWPEDGTVGEVMKEGHDYNFFWTPEQVAEMVKLMRPMLDARGLDDVGLTCGENTNWYRFSYWGYAQAFKDDPEALDKLDLITSHGFYVGHQSATRWFGPHSNVGIELLRAEKPELHAWCTSTSWDEKNNDLVENNAVNRRYIMNAHFVKEMHGNIYEAGVNGIIPWAFIQTKTQWNKPDPNPGSAIRVYEDGTWEVQKGYYYLKQVSQAGRPGMQVVRTTVLDSEIAIIGFSQDDTTNPDAFVVVNFGSNDWPLDIALSGTKCKSFEAFRTSGEEVYKGLDTADDSDIDGDNFRELGTVQVKDGAISYTAPAGSVTTFIGAAE